MAKKKAKAPSFFDDDDPAAQGPGAYGKDAPPDRSLAFAVTSEGMDRLAASLGAPAPSAPETPKTPAPSAPVRDQLHAIAAEVVAEYREADARRIGELEDAIRRAIGFLAGEQYETARTVLEEVAGT